MKTNRISISPMEARTEVEVCDLQTDNVESAEHWMQINGVDVQIVAQRRGEAATSEIRISRSIFNRFMRWYTKQQPVNKKNPLRK